ncbi:MAG: glycosyltransferase [Deinococcales bacterium]
MRVALVGQTYLPSTNGPAVFTTNLAEALAACGHEVLAVIPAPDGRPGSERRHGVELRALPAIVSKRAGVAVTAFPNRRVGRLLDAFAPDVVHIQDHYPTSRAVLAESRRRGLAVVGTNHFIPGNMALQLPLPRMAHGAVEAVLWWTVRAVFGRLDLATAPSETAARLLRERIPDLDVRAISCGVDVGRFRPRTAEERRALRARLDLPENGVVVLYVGRLDRDKNLELLLEALTRAPDVDRLMVAGKGLHMQALIQRARRLGLAERVRAGALPELVTTGTHGALFDPRDAADAGAALQGLATARERWGKLGRAARIRAEEHRLERTRERFEALYAEAAAGTRTLITELS